LLSDLVAESVTLACPGGVEVDEELLAAGVRQRGQLPLV